MNYFTEDEAAVIARIAYLAGRASTLPDETSDSPARGRGDVPGEPKAIVGVMPLDAQLPTKLAAESSAG